MLVAGFCDLLPETVPSAGFLSQRQTLLQCHNPCSLAEVRQEHLDVSSLRLPLQSRRPRTTNKTLLMIIVLQRLMATRSKIKLEYSSNDLNEMLEQSQYVKKKLKNPPRSPALFTEFTPDRFGEVYALIQKMRAHGPEQLYDRLAPIQEQRFQILVIIEQQIPQVALLISPQTKDEVTGRVMRRFLEQGCTIDRVATTPVEDIKKIIYEANFNTTKANRIANAARRIKDDLGGVMPETYDHVLLFDGVGEKIALLYMLVAMKEVVASLHHQCLGIAVDVNVMRVANRIPLSRDTSPGRMRRTLEQLVPRKHWEQFNQDLVGFGQQICRPNGRELCDSCLLRQGNLCQFGYEKTLQVSKSKSKGSKAKGQIEANEEIIPSQFQKLDKE